MGVRPRVTSNSPSSTSPRQLGKAVSQLPPTVFERVFEYALQSPSAVALQRCDGSSSIRFGQLVLEVNRLAEMLAASRVTRGSRVFVLSDNGPETYLAVLASAKIGAIAVMVDGNLPPAGIERTFQITEPTAILITPASRAQSTDLPASLQETPTLAVDLAFADWGEGSTLGGASLAGPVDQGADDPLAMILTSGTTGEPKAVLLPNRTFYAVADLLLERELTWIDWVVGEAAYSPLPATHIGGLWWILNCLMHGSRCITGGEGRLSFIEILAKHVVATTCVVPTLLSRLVGELKSSKVHLPALRLVGYGGSRAIAADVRFMEDSGIRTLQVYGLSETGCTALCLPTDNDSIAKIEAGAVGRPYPGVQTYLSPDGGAGPTDLENRPSADFGTLWIKSPANMLGYWNNPARTGEVLVNGWVNTGDLLERHEDGFFYIKGRSSEMIISGGVNVVPDEVDRIAESVAGVRDVACYEIPDDEFGALVGLAVIPLSDLDHSEARKLKNAIAARFREESESIARPSTIVIVQEIPRTPSGKVMRSSLAATLTSGGRT